MCIIKRVTNYLKLKKMTNLTNQTKNVYCVLNDGTHKLVDDKSLATRLCKKDAEHMLTSYGNATIEELNNSDFDRYIVVAQTRIN